jgi:Domain of unknown function (DUF6471)
MNIKSEEEWAELAAALINHKLRETEVTYVELAKRLKKHGFKEETEASVTNKLKRRTFPATWFLAVLAACLWRKSNSASPELANSCDWANRSTVAGGRTVAIP